MDKERARNETDRPVVSELYSAASKILAFVVLVVSITVSEILNTARKFRLKRPGSHQSLAFREISKLMFMVFSSAVIYGALSFYLR